LFREELKDKLKKVFGFKKTSFDAPNAEAFEQDTLFIEIENVQSRATQGTMYARVQGRVTTFSQQENLTYCYFAKRLTLADPALTKKFFFYDMDREILSSPAKLQNLSERRTAFVFLFEKQFDPTQPAIEGFDVETMGTLIDSGDGALIDSGDKKDIKS
jgi:hypothetical protein